MSLADATDFLGAPDAERLISRAWRRGAARLRGVRPGESHPVEIPSSEEGEIDCVDSRIGEGVLLTTYQTVTIAWDDVRRLTQPSTRDGASDADILEAEAGPLVKAVALELLRQFP